MCEKENLIHPFIYEIGEHDYTLSDDLYLILEQFGNIFQAIKIEITIEGFYKRFIEIKDKIVDFINIFDNKLNTKPIEKKINTSLQEGNDPFKILNDEGVKISEKFEFEKIDKNQEPFSSWYGTIISLLNNRFDIQNVEKKLKDLKKYYTGKEKKYSYLDFIEKISFNEGNIIDTIQNVLIDLRKELIIINDEISKHTKKDLKLLNLDYEKYHIMSSDD
jgi:hypothetical protein